ncbi:long-chain-fatty-acid--CoA ligase-like [Musca vetustissima]|uniref:long-chain-fatty-acid--CoA ligase-like n=1 Tax=Musca vetustissima TaxID=27455 RepID=UPI002AB73999|nr:long-chain-fatty-acid--CoA ligase-like [Musca vetustissima]
MVASFLAGTPVNALYPGFDKDSVSVIYKVTRPKILFCEVSNYPIAQDINRELQLEAKIFIMNDDERLQGVGHIEDLLKIEKSQIKSDFRYGCHDLNGDDIALIMCSSGTTGTPKGVMCSHRSLLNQKVCLTLKSDSIISTFSTMYWISGILMMLSSLTSGCLRVITSRSFTTDYFLGLIERHKITHFFASGTYMAELCMYKDIEHIQRALASIDTLLVAGSKIPLAVQEKMNGILACNTRRPGFNVVYGMTELSGILSSNLYYVADGLEGTEGKLLPNTRVQICDKKGQRLGAMEHGEICIWTPYPWKGYFKNPEATKKALKHDWLQTGDIGFFDTEGFLHVCSRDNDVFKSNNFQIYPPMIEDVIYRLPGIAETCIVGIPDLVAANLIGCAVVRNKTVEGLKLSTRDVVEHVKAHMGSMYHITDGVYFIESLPKTGSGKIKRSKVLELIMEIRNNVK